jgi:hypothetical protein
MDLKRNKYYKHTIKYYVLNVLQPLIKKVVDEEVKADLTFLNKISNKSKYKKELNHANIYYRSIGNNVFIVVLFKDRIIFNTSLGKFKIKKIKIKKKEKKFKNHLYEFSKKFIRTFFGKLRRKYKIKYVSLNFMGKKKDFRLFKKNFFYKLSGLLYKKRKIFQSFVFLRNNYLRLKKHRTHIKVKDKKYLTNRQKKFFIKLAGWKRSTLRKYFEMQYFNRKVIYLRNIKIINRFPYNGCKSKRIKKI